MTGTPGQAACPLPLPHHDHIGIAPERDERGDRIYNGAVDNASGVGALLSIARAYASLPKPPPRSMIPGVPVNPERPPVKSSP